MKNVTISTFSLRVKGHMGRSAEYYELDKLPTVMTRKNNSSHSGLLGLLEEYLHHIARVATRDENTLSILSASEIHTTSHSVSAFLKRGEYGIQSDMLNVTKKKITYHRSVSDAEMMPYYFLAAVPADSKMGIAAFQMGSNTGIKSQFEQGFEDFVRKKCGRCDLEIDKLVPKKLVKQYFKHVRVARLRFVRLTAPRTIDQAYMDGNTETTATLELQIKPKRGSTFLLTDNIQDVLNKQTNAKDFLEIKDFEYNTVKVDVNVDGKYRTIDLAKPDNFQAEYDITEKVKPYHGHPTYRKIDGIAREIVREIMDNLGMDSTGV